MHDAHLFIWKGKSTCMTSIKTTYCWNHQVRTCHARVMCQYASTSCAKWKPWMNFSEYGLACTWMCGTCACLDFKPCHGHIHYYETRSSYKFFLIMPSSIQSIWLSHLFHLFVWISSLHSFETFPFAMLRNMMQCCDQIQPRKCMLHDIVCSVYIFMQKMKPTFAFLAAVCPSSWVDAFLLCVEMSRMFRTSSSFLRSSSTVSSCISFSNRFSMPTRTLLTRWPTVVDGLLPNTVFLL